MKKLFLSLLVLGLLLVTPIITPQVAAVAQGESDRLMILDVAFDGRTIRGNSGAPPDLSTPRGATFILNGKIFVGQTLPSGAASNSPDDPGSIGTFYCRGTFNYALADILAGVPGSELEVVTSQLFVFDNGSGLTTEGLEGGVRTVRAVTGGFGKDFSGASGEMRVERIGTNATGLFNIRCTFRIKRSSIRP